MSEAFDLHWDRGWELYGEKKLEAANAEWREAIRLKPDNAQALCSLASALSAPGYSPEALAAVQAAIQHAPQNA